MAWPPSFPIKAGGNATITADRQVRLFPNPVHDELTVRLPFAVEAVQSTAVTDATGVPLLLNTHRVTAEGDLRIGVGQLPGGLYVLRLDTDRGVRVVKFLKQ